MSENKETDDMIADATAELDSLVQGGEEEHYRADDILCEVLEKLGYTELVAAYHRVQPKWYA